MKYTIFILAMVLASMSQLPLNAQNSKTSEVEFKVDGVCKMCKERIENAAYIKGVKFTEWKKETQTLKVVFNPTKTNSETIQKNVASKGHSTELFEADSLAYKKLPACCAYQDGVDVH